MKLIDRPVPYRWLPKGDLDRCEEFRGVAEMLLINLETRISRFGMSNHVLHDRRTLATGVYIHVSSVCGFAKIAITAPAIEKKEAEAPRMPRYRDTLCIRVTDESENETTVTFFDPATGAKISAFEDIGGRPSLVFPVGTDTAAFQHYVNYISPLFDNATGELGDWWNPVCRYANPYLSNTGSNRPGGAPLGLGWSKNYLDWGSLTESTTSIPDGYIKTYSHSPVYMEVWPVGTVNNIYPAGVYRTLSHTTVFTREDEGYTNLVTTTIEGPQIPTRFSYGFAYCSPNADDADILELDAVGVSTHTLNQNIINYERSIPLYQFEQNTDEAVGSVSFILPWAVDPFISITLSNQYQYTREYQPYTQEYHSTHTGYGLAATYSSYSGMEGWPVITATCDLVRGWFGVYGIGLVALYGDASTIATSYGVYNTQTQSWTTPITDEITYDLENYDLAVDFAFCPISAPTEFLDEPPVSNIRMEDMVSEPGVTTLLTEVFRDVLVAARDQRFSHDPTGKYPWPGDFRVKVFAVDFVVPPSL